jgi:hypothetical protein
VVADSSMISVFTSLFSPWIFVTVISGLFFCVSFLLSVSHEHDAKINMNVMSIANFFIFSI